MSGVATDRRAAARRGEAQRNPLDPMSLPVLWDRLIAIADEAAINLLRTCFSPTLRDAHDFICGVLDTAGRSVAEKSNAIPGFISALPRTMQFILKQFPASAWRPGDAVITNDPWIGTGHLPDFTIATPIFCGDKLIGFAGSVAHMSDVGGALFAADTRQMFEEGIRIPITHFYKEGAVNQTLVDILQANVRVPNELLGDLHSMLVANRTIEQRTLEFLAEEKLSDLDALAGALQDRAELAMRNAIAALPDGTWHSEVEIDGYDSPLTIRLAVTVAGSDITFDYSGTSPQQARAINVPMTNTYAMTAFPAKCLLDPQTPRNDGSYRPIRVAAPDGCLVNPSFPAPVNARHLTFLHLASAVFQALGEIMPDRVIAESGAPLVQFVFSGRTSTGEPYVYVSMDAPGMGARAGKDGLSATPYPNNVGGAPVEVIETTTSLLVRRRRLVPDSGGPGEFRGGLGLEIEFEQTGAWPADVSLLGDRVSHPARGIKGGAAGSAAMVRRNGNAVDPKGRTVLMPGDRVYFRNAGGGGYGPPGRRDPALLRRDIEEGYITTEGARRYE